MLERKGGEALWRQIGDSLLEEIASKKLTPGSRLPTEPDLADRFKVSRNTVRRAMSMLENNGIVRIEQGRGTFVHDDILDYTISKRTRFTENLKSQGLDPGYDIKRVEEIPAPADVATMLKIKSGQKVVVVEAASYADDVVISCSHAYYPAVLFPGFVEKRAKAVSTSALLAEYGILDYKRLATRITTRPPTDGEARSLQQPRSRWVLCTQKVDVNASGRPICYSESVWAGDRVQFVVDFSEAD